jgi:hypothetical protein
MQSRVYFARISCSGIYAVDFASSRIRYTSRVLPLTPIPTFYFAPAHASGWDLALSPAAFTAVIA